MLELNCELIRYHSQKLFNLQVQVIEFSFFSLKKKKKIKRKTKIINIIWYLKVLHSIWLHLMLAKDLASNEKTGGEHNAKPKKITSDLYIDLEALKDLPKTILNPDEEFENQVTKYTVSEGESMDESTITEGA